jgi:putative transposase
MSRYRFIAAERGHYPVRRLCQVLDVPASGYYAWQAGQQRAVEAARPAWETALVKAFRYHKRRYGTRRLQVALRQQGHRVGRQRLRVAMRREGLHALQTKAFTPRTTDSTHGLRCAPNRLLDQPKPTQANRVWVSDITYLPLANGDWVVPGRAYLCAFQDMGTKHVVGRTRYGWHVGATMPEELVTTALQRAFFAQPPTPGLVVHSDRGGQYWVLLNK